MPLFNERAKTRGNNYKLQNHFFIMTYESIVSIWNSLLNSVVDACTVNAFKARDKFWHHQLVKFDFIADLTGTGNRSEEVIK